MVKPFIPFPNTIEIDAHYLVEDIPCENVYHVHGGAAWTSTSMAAAAAAFATWEAAEAAHHRSSDVLFVGAHVRDLTTATSGEVDHTDNVAGVLTGPRLPNHCTIAIKAGTGIAGRSFRGRTYWIGLTQDQLDTNDCNLIVIAVANAIVAHMAALIAVAWPNSGQLVVASRRTGGTDRTTGVSTPIIEYSLVDRFVDSQRRRLPAHNRHR